MHKGFVLQWKGENKEGNAFATAYKEAKDRCFTNDTFWFGWCETDRRLPRLFDSEALNPRWDVARIFSPTAELRAQRHGLARLVLLLTENESLRNELTQGPGKFELVQTLNAEPGCRVLVGEKPGTLIPGTSPDALIEVAFPRELDYGIPAEPEKVLVADVQCYFDDEHRLRFVRYCSVQAEEKGRREVKPYVAEID